MASPHRSIATVCLSGTLADRLHAAAAAGFDGVEIFENDLVASPESVPAIRARIADLGLVVELYQPFRDAEGAPPERFARVQHRLRRKLEVMEQLGADTVLICSSVAPDTVDDDELAADQLRRLADQASERGMRIAYEALAWGRHVSTWEHSWRIVQRADHPALGLCLDSFHVLSRTSDVDAIAQLPGQRIFFLQLADAPRLSMDVLQWSRHHRLFPLQGGLDLPGFTRAVMASGYSGPISLEVFNDVFRQSEPHRTAVDAMRSLVALDDAVAADRSSLVAPAQLSGFTFVELSVDGRSRPQLQQVLGTLGFRHAGQHRSKPVELWQQGAARVLLNCDTVTTGEGSSAVTALAVESDDPGASVRRAQQLSAAPLPRHRGSGEADLAAVAAPDGLQLFFCRTEPDGWLTDFLPTGVPERAGAGITHIDHVTLTQPYDRFYEAGLFYRSVLGLRDDDAAEYAAPFGLIRSLAVHNADDTVRLALSVPLLRRGEWAPGVDALQHVTLVTDDMAATVRALADAGASTLPIPANYYDDLDARLGLDAGLLDDLRRMGVMYDEDDTGRYLQLFTPILGNRVFFEIVQRRTGYRGYGTLNDAVRMAAHRARRLDADPPLLRGAETCRAAEVVGNDCSLPAGR